MTAKTPRPLRPEDIARLAAERLAAQANPEKARGGEKYFRHTVKLYGVPAPAVRALAADLHASIRHHWTVDDAISLCDILFPKRELEAKAVAALVLARFKPHFPKSLFAKAKRWLASDLLDNWASVDLFCTDTLGALILKYPDLACRIKAWAFHPNRWIKRASAVSFIKLARRDEFLPAIYEISASLFLVDDDLIRKGNGWLLREAGKRDMELLAGFLLRHGPAVPRTTLRYAIERFPEARRRSLLRETRG